MKWVKLVWNQFVSIMEKISPKLSALNSRLCTSLCSVIVDTGIGVTPQSYMVAM